MAKKISNIAVTALSNGAHYNFMRMTLDRAGESEAVKNKAASEISALQAAFDIEDERLKTMTKSELTELISENDARRDNDYYGIKNLVNRFLSFQADNVKAAAKKLWRLIESYQINPDDQLDKETGMIANFIDDLEKKFATEVETLGLNLLVNDMKEANEQVYALMRSRDTAKSTKVAGAMKAARAATDTAYRTFVEKVNALAVVEGDTAYASFIDEMNTQIIRYKREALNQSVSSSTTTTDGSTTTTEDDAPVVDDGGGTDEGGGTVSEDDIPEVM